MSDNETALQLLKKYYKDFYNKHAATKPSKVKRIEYFLEWLNSSACASDIVVTEETFHTRHCSMEIDIDYVFSNGSGAHYHDRIRTTAYFSTQSILSQYYKDIFYSSYASSEITPDNIKKVAAERAKDALYNSAVADRAVFHKATILSIDWDDPKADQLLSCTIKYPHPKADKNGNNIRSFSFVIWNGELHVSGGPANANANATSSGDGCYVATCVYGSYDCPETWTLRRYRDNVLGSTWYGRLFIRLYYAISPTLVKWFGHTNWFKRLWRGRLDRMVKKLRSRGVEDTPYEDKNW